MHRIHIFFLALLFTATLSVSLLPAQELAGLYQGSLVGNLLSPASTYLPAEEYTVNFSISHGHCQLPIDARFKGVSVKYGKNNLEDLRVDFDVSTQSMKASHEDSGELTQNLRSAESFDVDRFPSIRFVSTNNYHLGTDWYQINGNLTIKGETRKASFRARPIYDSAGCGRILKKVVLDGSVNLNDFGFPEKYFDDGEVRKEQMYINMVVRADGC